MTHYQPLTVQAQLAYESAINSPCPDWRAVAELFRAALRGARKREPKSSKAPQPDVPPLADYSVDRVKLKYRSPRIAVRFMDGEAVFTHVPSAPGKPLNVGRALRVAICMWRYRVYRRLGYRQYETTIPVPEIFQVRCLETDELFDVDACNEHTAGERASNAPERAAAMLRAAYDAGGRLSRVTAGAQIVRSPCYDALRKNKCERQPTQVPASQPTLLGQMLGHKDGRRKL